MMIDTKQIAGRALIDREITDGFLRSGTKETVFRIGLGTGTTAIWAVRRLAECVAAGDLNHILCVPTSTQTQLEAQANGLPVTDLNDPRVGGRVDWAFDGADQVSPEGYLIKGGGAAHAREKLVEHSAGRFVVVVDEIKLVDSIGGDPSDGGFAIPIEVMPLAIAQVSKAVEALGAKVTPRESKGKIGPVMSDNGLVIIDAVFAARLKAGTESDPARIEKAIKVLPGVLDVGIFSCPVAAVYAGRKDGTVDRLGLKPRV